MTRGGGSSSGNDSSNNDSNGGRVKGGKMHGPLPRFLKESRPSRSLATSALRLVFAGMFLSQLALAGVMALLVLALNGQASFPPTVLGPVLAVLSLLQCGVGVFLPELVARPGSKGAILAATLLAAVLLATPGWFLMLALITAQRPLPLLVMCLAVALGYALGFLLTGRFGRRAASVVPAA